MFVWLMFVCNLMLFVYFFVVYYFVVVYGDIEDWVVELYRFCQDFECIVLLFNLVIFGEGVSFYQICYDVVYVDCDFFVGWFMQSFDCIYCLGLLLEIIMMIIVLVVEKMVDELVEQWFVIKFDFFGKIFDDPVVLELVDF